MQASYSKLQEYFSEKLPDPEKLAELLTFHSYEVTGIKKVNGDYIFDIDVLPNRAGDSSEDAGVVKEISAILNTPFKKKPFEKKESTLKISVSGLEINKLLGSDIPAEEIENIFKRLGFEYKIKEDEFTVSVPFSQILSVSLMMSSSSCLESSTPL